MTSHAVTGKGRWIAAGIGAVVVLGLLAPLLTLTRIVPLPAPDVRQPPPVKLADPSPANPLVRELTAMRDLAPLFLPTNRNATVQGIPRRAIGRTRLDSEMTKLSLAEAELRFEREIPAAGTLNGKPVTEATAMDALAQAATAPAVLGFGREVVPLEPLPPRGGYLEVVAVGTGERIFGEPLDPALRPPTDKAWAPLQFLASVNAAGLASPLILAERSGAEEVDQHFRNLLAQTYRVGDRLPPGIYRITVGP